MYVTLFLGNRSLLFSETLQLVRACKHEKNVPRSFLIIFTVLAILTKKWSKLAIWLDVWESPFKGWKSLKNLNVGVFETDFKAATTNLESCKAFGPDNMYQLLSGKMKISMNYSSISVHFPIP